MTKDKRSFFERLTGAPISGEEESEGINSNYEEETSEEWESSPAKEINLYDESGSDTEDGELAMDVAQTDNEIIVQTIVAGVKPDNIDISITPNNLTIRGSREDSKKIKEGDYIQQELYWGSFSRSISLPQEVSPDDSEAITKNGVLTIKMPLANKTKAHKLKVREG